MRLLRLELLAVGPFTNRNLDFATDPPGLHIVFGPNEAGKSSSLRALKALLYGFPSQTEDSFIHGYDQLRVAGRLRNAGGEELYFQRRKKRLGDIIDAAGKPLDPSVLLPFLLGTDAKLFTSIYGIDHETLVQGGQEILAQKGEVGRALFAAGAGISSVSQVVRDLEVEAGELFKATGSKPKINEAIKKYRELQARLKTAGLSVREWKEQQNALAEAQSLRASLEHQRDENNAELHRLARLRQAIPELAAVETLRRKIKDLGDVVVLDPDFSVRYQRANQDVREVSARLQLDRQRLAKLTERSAAIVVHPLILQQAENIDNLHLRLGEYRKGRLDRPERNGMRISLRTEAGRLLQLIRPDLGLDGVEQLRPMLLKKKAVQDLATRYAAIQQQLMQAAKIKKSAEQECQGLYQEIAQANRNLEDPSLLLRIVAECRKAGDLDGQISRGQQEKEAIDRVCTADLQRIGLWNGTLYQLLALSLPFAATIQRFEEIFNRIEERLREVEKQQKKSKEEREKVVIELAKLTAAGEVPTVGELIKLRQQRDAGWTLIRRIAAQGGDIESANPEYFGDKPLAVAYEENVQGADMFADRIRQEADRVATAVSLHWQLQSLDDDLARCEQEKEALLAEKTRQKEDWGAVWQKTSIRPLSPKEMAHWIAEIEKLRLRIGELIKKEEQLAEEKRRRTQLRSNLWQALSLYQVNAITGEELDPLLAMADLEIERLSRKKADLDKLQERLALATKEKRRGLEELQLAEGALSSWRQEWGSILSGLGLKTGVTPNEAGEILDTLQACFDRLKEAEELQKRIDGIDRDAAELGEQVRLLVQLVAPTLQSMSLEQAIVQLRELLEKERHNTSMLAELTRETAVLQKEIEATEATYILANQELTHLMQEARCDDLSLMPQVIDRFRQYQEFKPLLLAHEKNLENLAQGRPVATLVEQAKLVAIDKLPYLVEQLEQNSKEKLNPEINHLSQIIGEVSARLAAMDGNAGAAQIAEEMEEELTRLRRLVRRYTLIKVAAKVLQQAIDRYRENHQDPILKEASCYFKQITLGSFAGIRTDVDDNGQPILVGLRSNDMRLTVENMSSGTRDQLYLALRLATLKWQAQTHETMPFVVDDILINFDDNRSLETLKILAEMGETNQVILFTHHRRLMEEAKLLAGEKTVQIHDLSCPA